MPTNPRFADCKREGSRIARDVWSGREDTLLLHAAFHADVYHSQVWRKQLEKRVAANPETGEKPWPPPKKRPISSGKRSMESNRAARRPHS